LLDLLEIWTVNVRRWEFMLELVCQVILLSQTGSDPEIRTCLLRHICCRAILTWTRLKIKLFHDQIDLETSCKGALRALVSYYLLNLIGSRTGNIQSESWA
jgi:hypothetical protein